MSTLCFSDLHANYDLWQQIKEYIKPEDTVFCLGDCVDRGDCGLEILNEVLETPNITLLRGNHEDFIDSIGSEALLCEEPEDFYWISNLELWEANGAKNTIKAFSELSKAKQKDLINKIRQLPTHVEYTNTKGDVIYLCHAGRHPYTEETIHITKSCIPVNNYIWDRNHIRQLKWDGKDNEYCVHGHTPVVYMYHYSNSNANLPKSIFEIYKYCEGHKIDIDLGVFETYTTCLLDLDTFEPIYFKDRTIK